LLATACVTFGLAIYSTTVNVGGATTGLLSMGYTTVLCLFLSEGLVCGEHNQHNKVRGLAYYLTIDKTKNWEAQLAQKPCSTATV
jgi:hypothetical protein